MRCSSTTKTSAGPKTGWEPRTLDADTIAALRRPVGMMARLTMGKVPARVTLMTPDGETVATVGRGPELTSPATSGSSRLFVAGRDEARLTFSDAQAAQAVRAARRGL